MPSSSPDFRLDGYEAANDRVKELFQQHIEIDHIDLTVLAEHHTADHQHSYYVLHNRAVTWGIPGEPQLVALHIRRDVQSRTFRFQKEQLPLFPMAQSWLIARGCPKEDLHLREGVGTDPADEPTTALQDRLTSDGDHFALLHSYTHDGPSAPQTTVLLRATDEQATVPFRVLLEEVDYDNWTHTLREGGFASFQDATNWWEQHWSGQGVPLPAGPSPTRGAAPSVSPGLPGRSASPRGPGR